MGDRIFAALAVLPLSFLNKWLNSTICFKKTEAKKLARLGRRLNSTVCFKKAKAKQLARQGFCPSVRCDDLCLVFKINPSTMLLRQKKVVFKIIFSFTIAISTNKTFTKIKIQQCCIRKRNKANWFATILHWYFNCFFMAFQTLVSKAIVHSEAEELAVCLWKQTGLKGI